MFLVVNGSARPNSASARVARVLAAALASQGDDARVLDLADHPDPSELFAARGLVVVVEEVGGGFAGELKQYLDRVSVPEVFAHLPCAFVGVSTGPWGAVRAVEQVELALHALGAHLFGTRIFMRQIDEVIDAEGEIADPARCARLQSMMHAFAGFVHALALAAPLTEELELSEPEPEPYDPGPDEPSAFDEEGSDDFEDELPTVVEDALPPGAALP